MKKPYIKKLSKIQNFVVWQVDGEYIRNNKNIEFTNFGSHDNFKFIPKNEFWIDKEATPNETKYFINHMFLYHYLISLGIDKSKAYDIADKAEKKEREHSEPVKVKKTADAKKAHIKLIKSLSAGKIKVWIVDGKYVRDNFFDDFTEGGNDTAYKFVPKNEIWLDNDLEAKERKFILLHELHENYLMKSEKLKYDKAHMLASATEHYYRSGNGNINTAIQKYLRLLNEI